jgi:hypothetical protein
MEVPPMSQEEAEELQYFLKIHSLDWARIDELEERLEESLAELEEESVQSLFTSQSLEQAKELSGRMGSVGGGFRQIADWIGKLDPQVSAMWRALEEIKARTSKLDVQERNYERLRVTLEQLIADLTLDDEVVTLLRTPDFKQRYKATLAAAKQLDTALNRKLEGGLDTMEGPHAHTRVRARVHTHTHTYSYIHAHSHIHTNRHTHTNTHTHAYARAHSHTHTHTHAYAHVHTHTHTHTHTHAHTNIDTQTLTLTHTHTHTHARARTHRGQIAACKANASAGAVLAGCCGISRYHFCRFVRSY